MSVDTGQTRATRAPLSRDRVLRAAVGYVNEHGLDALSMHKLGATLSVAAMALYKHVANKDDLLDGIVEQLWAEIPVEPRSTDWRAAVTELARSLRALVHRHPHAAPLLTSRQGFQERMLHIYHGQLRVMRDGGVPEKCAVGLLGTVVPYGIGFALAELSFRANIQDGTRTDADEVGRIRRISNLLSPQAPDDLVRTAMLMCGDCDMDAQFDIGIELMVHGLDAYLRNLVTEGCS